jgi:acetolactate synthase-1/2/3 large subunit
MCAGAEELDRVYRAALPINSGMANFAAAARAMKPVDGALDQICEARADAKNIEPNQLGPGQHHRSGRLAEQAPADDVIVTNGAGSYAAFLPLLPVSRLSPQLATSGALGYGVPAAVAARSPANRLVVSFAATAAR